MTHLALPSLAASWVGWWRYRRVLHPDQVLTATLDLTHPGPVADSATRGASPSAAQQHALVSGGLVVGVVLIGFVAGRSVGIKPWMVALAADVVLLAIVRRVPWRDIPWGIALVAGSLGVLAAAAVGHLSVGRVVGGSSTLSLARTVGATAVAANVVNNLPALLVSLPSVGHHPSPALWALLIGVNMGPVLLVTGSLASLLWLDTLGRLGVRVHARDFTRVGLRVGLPAAATGAAAFLALNAMIR